MLDKLKVGGLVKLSDKQTCLNDGNGLVSFKTYTVKSIKTLVEQNNNCTFRLVELESDNLVLIIKEATDGEWYGIIGFQPPDFPVDCTREEAINNGCQWIFQEPKNINDYQLADLEFAKVINNEGGDYLEVNQTIYGRYYEVDKVFGLAHLRCGNQVENPELVIFEYGDFEENNTVISVYQGVLLQDNELEIF